MSGRATFQVTHRTTYRYRRPVAGGYSQARLLPRQTPAQSCRAATLLVEPAPADRADHRDRWGNLTTFLAIDRHHRELTVTARSEVDVVAEPASPPGLDQPWERHRVDPCTARPHEWRDLEAAELAMGSPLAPIDPALAAWAAPCFPADRPLGEAVRALTRRIHEAVAYVPGSTDVLTTPVDVLAQGRGVCQDHAHLLVSCLRSLGLAARYVSGYLETTAPPGHHRLIGADASHAWAAVHVVGGGWFDVDPTNDAVPAGRHITVGWGRDFADVTPLKGVVFSGDGHHDLEVAVDVERVGTTTAATEGAPAVPGAPAATTPDLRG